jgi:hypothetical protein
MQVYVSRRRIQRQRTAAPTLRTAERFIVHSRRPRRSREARADSALGQAIATLAAEDQGRNFWTDYAFASGPLADPQALASCQGSCNGPKRCRYRPRRRDRYYQHTRRWYRPAARHRCRHQYLDYMAPPQFDTVRGCRLQASLCTTRLGTCRQ